MTKGWYARRIGFPMVLAGAVCVLVIRGGGDARNTLWQASISLGVYYTIQIANGANKTWGLLFGAGVQVLNVAYGVVTHQWGFTFSALGMLGFVEVWSARRRAASTGSGRPGGVSEMWRSGIARAAGRRRTGRPAGDLPEAQVSPPAA